LQQLHLAVKANQKGFVLLGQKNRAQKTSAGLALLVDHARLARAGVNQKAQGEWQIVLVGKEADSLLAAIFADREIVLAQVLHQSTIPVAHGGVDVDQARIHFEVGRRLLLSVTRSSMAGKPEGHSTQQKTAAVRLWVQPAGQHFVQAAPARIEHHARTLRWRKQNR